MTDTKPTLPELVEPLATVYDAYDTGCDWHCRYPPAVGAKIYDQSAIDSLQSALQVAQQELDKEAYLHKLDHSLADRWLERATEDCMITFDGRIVG